MIRKKERRAYPRLPVYHLAKYKLISQPKEEPPVTTSIKDVSGGGICLRLDEHLPVSAVIQLYINFPRIPQTITALAKVVWIKQIGKSKRYEAGVQFLEIEDTFRQAIVKRVESVRKITNGEVEEIEGASS